jgi:hypothetical protein
MADALTLSGYQNWLTEMMISRQLTFAVEYPALAQMSGALPKGGYDPTVQRYTRGMAELAGDRDTFHGKQISVPLQLNDVPGATGMADGGTFAANAPFDTNKAVINLADTGQPIGITLDADRDSRNGSTSAMNAIEALVESAYRGLARVENDFIHGTGDSLLVKVNSSTGSGSLVVDVGTSNVPWDQLTPGRVVSILTRSNGADPGNGKRRKIASIQKSAGTVTFATAAVASDGGSGNITFSSAEGIYIDSSYGHAAQGLGQATANSTTFEGIDQSAVAQWQAQDATPSATAALSDEILDNATYLLRGAGCPLTDLYGLAHKKVLDLYKQSKQSQVLYNAEADMIEMRSGTRAITYTGTDAPVPLISDLNAPRGVLRLVGSDAVQLYGDEVGPSFINDDGHTWRFTSRATVKEAWLYDRWQLGVKNAAHLCTIGNGTTKLTEAA